MYDALHAVGYTSPHFIEIKYGSRVSFEIKKCYLQVFSPRCTWGGVQYFFLFPPSIIEDRQMWFSILGVLPKQQTTGPRLSIAKGIKEIQNYKEIAFAKNG